MGSIGAQLEPGRASELSKVKVNDWNETTIRGVLTLCSREPSRVPAIFQSNVSIQWSCKSAGRIRFNDIGEQALLCRYEYLGRSVIGFVRLSLLVVTHIQVVRV